MPKAKSVKVLRGGLDVGPAVVGKPARALSEIEQRTITHKAAIDSACSGQWVYQIVHERLDAYPPPANKAGDWPIMRLGSVCVLTPPWNAPAEDQCNSGGLRGTRRWMPPQCRTIEDGLDALKIGEVWKVAQWPSAIRYDHMHAGRDAKVYDPRPRRHEAAIGHVTRYVRLGNWPSWAVPEEPILIQGIE